MGRGNRVNRRRILAGAAAAAAIGAVPAWWYLRPEPGPAVCDGPLLTRADLDAAVTLAGGYLVAAQRPAGDFVYEVDWRTGVESVGNNAVRQAGSTWGLGLLHHETRDPATRVALDRALAFWRERVGADGDRRWVTHGSEKAGQTGTVALVGLTLVDRLRAPDGLDDTAQRDLRELLDGVLRFLRALRLPDGGYATAYDPTTGAPSGRPNPYVDGEVLLLLTQAGIHLELPELVTEALAVAERDYTRNVSEPRAIEADPDTTKGYYQWGSMSWFALASAGHASERLGGWLVELADWMVDVHHTLGRTRNTAYAYEGLLSAYAWARDHDDPVMADKLRCVAHQGLRRLFGWQLGHPLALAELAGADPRFLGGVQNEIGDPILRIDVTQHQLHAAMLAREHLALSG